MNLRGQHGEREAGYAMAALIVGLAVMGILASAAMPAWRQMAQREKEAELIFRGQQYARAIGLFQRRAGPGVNPPTIDVLVEQRFLRKKYKDPITGGDFDLISPVSQASATPGTLPGGAPTGGRGQTPASGQTGRGSSSVSSPVGGGATPGGIVGVASKSKERSIRIYNGRSFYNEWQFIFVPQVQQAGGAASPGGRGQRGQPGGPGGVGGVGAPGTRGRGPQVPQRGGPQGPQSPGGRGRAPQP
jgi:type II secretory pathway pseudopilin PulG